jgi:hypothetical protein
MISYLIQLVMAGPVRAIHASLATNTKAVDARHEAGHDEKRKNPRGVLKRRCAIGKTPLRLAPLCNLHLARHNPVPPE